MMTAGRPTGPQKVAAWGTNNRNGRIRVRRGPGARDCARRVEVRSQGRAVPWRGVFGTGCRPFPLVPCNQGTRVRCYRPLYASHMARNSRDFAPFVNPNSSPARALNSRKTSGGTISCSALFLPSGTRGSAAITLDVPCRGGGAPFLRAEVFTGTLPPSQSSVPPGDRSPPVRVVLLCYSGFDSAFLTLPCLHRAPLHTPLS